MHHGLNSLGSLFCVFFYVYELLVVGGVGVGGSDETLTNVCAFDQTATSGRQKGEKETKGVTNNM